MRLLTTVALNALTGKQYPLQCLPVCTPAPLSVPLAEYRVCLRLSHTDQFTPTMCSHTGLPYAVAGIQVSGGLYRIQHSTSQMLGQSPDHYRFPISDPAIALPCSRQTHLDGPTAQRTAAGVSNHVHNIAPNQERTFPAHTKCSLTSKCAH